MTTESFGIMTLTFGLSRERTVLKKDLESMANKSRRYYLFSGFLVL